MEKVVELPSETGIEPIAEDQKVTWILLVEDHASFRQALAFLLDAEPDLKVAAQAGSLAEARQAMKKSERIDIAVVDLALPDGDGVDLIRELSETNIPALVLSASVENAWFARAVEAGAVGVIHKANAIDEVVQAVRRLRAGEALLSQEEVVEMLRAASRVARLADGWIPAGVPLGAMEQMFAAIKQGAAEAGRDPGSLKLIVIAHAEFHQAPLGNDRPIFAGSAEQIEADILATRQLGAEELIFNALFSPDIGSTDDLLSRMEQLWTMARRAEYVFEERR